MTLGANTDDPAENTTTQKPWTGRVRTPSLAMRAYYGVRTLQNYVDAQVALFERYGDVVDAMLPTRVLMFFHPRHVRRILRTNVLNYPKSVEYDLLRPILGEGIFVSEGDLWTRQRRLLAPEFRENTVARFVPSMVECTERLLVEWDARAPRGPIDVSEDMMRLTLWVVGGALFKSDFQAEAEVIGHSLEVCLAHAVRRMLSMGLYKEWLPTRGNREAARAERDLNGAIMKIIHRSRGGGTGTLDVLSRMIQARDPDSGAAMTDRQLLDETKSLVLAGHETTSLALSWGFQLLAQHPEVEARLVEEVTRVLGDRTPTAQDIPRLEYTRRVFLEVMRLYPPVPAMSRSAVAADEFDGIRIKPGWLVGISPYVTHRHPEFWPFPERFDPERFAPERATNIEPYSYMPFLLGRRACLGEHFAMIEGVLLLAMLVRRYRLRPASPEPVKTRPLATLRLARPLIMHATLRSSV